MTSTIAFVVVIVIVGLIFLSFGSESESRRKKALQKLADFLGVKVSPIEGEENSYSVPFKFQGRECVFEDVQEKTYQGQIFHRGLLRVKLGINLTISFSENDPASVRDNVISFGDISNPWVQNIGKLSVPKTLNRFKVFTNNVPLVTMLFDDEQILKIFENFKNVDSRGHPVMSLEAFEGVLVLKFHAGGTVKPNLMNFYNNVSSIEEYLTRVNLVADRIEQYDHDIKARSA